MINLNDTTEKWIRNRKLNYWINFLRLPLVLLILLFLFVNLKVFLALLCFCSFAYYWIESIQIFNHRQTVPPIWKYAYYGLGSVIFSSEIYLAVVDIYKLILLTGIFSATFFLYKSYVLLFQIILKKNLHWYSALIIATTGFFGVGYLYFENVVYLAISVIILAIIYTLIYIIARIVVENSSTNRVIE